MIEIRVVSVNGAAPPQAISARFDERGGTIGRSDTNTLILPDPERHVSRLQARVVWENGRPELVNVGANPLDFDGRSVPNGERVALESGGRITIGGFVLEVCTSKESRPDVKHDSVSAAASDDPLGLFAGLSSPSPVVDDPFEMLGAGQAGPAKGPAGQAPVRPDATSDPFALFDSPGQSHQGPESSSHAMPVGREPADPSPGASAATPLNVIPDDFDPFADPFAQRPSEAPAPTLKDLGFGETPSSEPSELDDLFGLSPASQAPGNDLFSGSPLADWPADRHSADSSTDPLADLSSDPLHAASPLSPPTLPDQVPEIRGAFVPPSPGTGQAFLSWEQGPASIDTGSSAPATKVDQPAGPPVDPFAIGTEEGGDEVTQVRMPGADPLASSPIPPPAPPEMPSLNEVPPPSVARMPRPSPPAPDPPAASLDRSPLAPVSPADSDALAQAFLSGLGLGEGAVKLPQGMTPELMERVGQLLREATSGTLDLLIARAMTKREMRAEVTMIVSRDNNPLKFSPNVDVALTHLLAPQGKGFMTPTAAMRDAYEDLRAHQIGFMAGMRAALAGVLARFDPDTLQRRLSDKSMLDSLLPMNRRAKLWDLYTEMFRDIASEAEDDFHALFGKAFLRAYEEQVKQFDEEQ